MSNRHIFGRWGSGQLSGGTASVSDPEATAGTVVFVTCTKANTVNMGALSTHTVVPGVGFTVISNNIFDTSTFNWVAIG